jgi:fructose-specific PTS system IIA-like component
MSLEYHFICPLRNGIHARPASALEEVSRGFASEAILVNQRTHHAANSKSVLSLIGADIRFNDSCMFTVSGADEQMAMATLSDFLEKVFPHCDDAQPEIKKLNGKEPLPLALRDAGGTIFHGSPVVPGIARGWVVQVGKFCIPQKISGDTANDAGAEWRRLDVALQKLIIYYGQQLSVAQNKIQGKLIEAHRAIARDVEFHKQLHEGITQQRRTAAGAIADAEAHFSAMLAASGSQLLRERALDIQEVCLQLLRQIYGNAVVAMEIKLTADAIVVAESLTPGQFLALDRRFLKGLALAHTGSTSHTVILARSFGIPTLTGVSNLTGAKLNGQEAILDADAGVLVANLTDAARRHYVLEQQRFAERKARLQKFSAQPAATKDGHRIKIAANIATADESSEIFSAGADGVGLFRTEMLFLDRESAPDEAGQFETYRRVLEMAGNRPVTIRTLDIGGDKPLNYLSLPPEENPFLGYRGARIYPKFEPLFRTQIRALVRASAHGKLKLMFPMIATVDEVRWIKSILSEEQARCAAENLAFDPAIPLGAMIEIPAAAFAMNALCRELDFFSIGSNDLLQYFMAADRANAQVASLYDPLQPAFLRLLKQIVEGAHTHKKQIGICGEMSGQTKLFPLLVGLGLDEISVAAPAIVKLKAELAELTLPACRQLIEAALNCSTANEVAALLEKCAVQSAAPLLDPELIILDADAATKEAAVRMAMDRLYVLGRTEEPRVIEEAIWRREAVYSTGFGHGFAIPHCKTNAVKTNSLLVVKLRAPVAWDSLDGQSVRVVILLVVRETDSANGHMKVFAKLARQVMNENFRVRLEQETDAGALCEFLHETIQA